VRRTAALGAVVASAMCFGTLAILTNLAYAEGALPMPLLAWRFALAALLIGGLVALRSPRALIVPSADIARYATLALTGYGAASVCFFFALKFAPASVVAVLLYAYPAFVAIAERVFQGKPLTRAKLAAIGLTFVGCALVLDLFSETGGVGWQGIALGLGAAAGYTGFNLLSARWLPGRSRLVMMAYTFGIAGLGTAAIALLFGTPLSAAEWSPRLWVLLALIVAIPTFAAIVLYLEGIRGLGPSQAAIISTLEPIFTILLAAVFLGERLSPVQSAGAVLVVIGVVLAELGARPSAVAVMPEAVEG